MTTRLKILPEEKKDPSKIETCSCLDKSAYTRKLFTKKECKEIILEYLAKSNEFDMYIAFSEQGEAYIYDNDFGLINHMKKMLRILLSEHYIADSSARPQAKRYVEMYLWYQKEPPQDDLPDLPF